MECNVDVLLIICDKNKKFCASYESIDSQEIIQQLISNKFSSVERFTNSDVISQPLVLNSIRR
jgi:hypothetical protein